MSEEELRAQLQRTTTELQQKDIQIQQNGEELRQTTLELQQKGAELSSVQHILQVLCTFKHTGLVASH